MENQLAISETVMHLLETAVQPNLGGMDYYAMRKSTIDNIAVNEYEFVAQIDRSSSYALVGVDYVTKTDNKKALHHEMSFYLQDEKRARTRLSDFERKMGIVYPRAHEGKWIPLNEYARVNQNYRILFSNEVAPNCEVVLAHNPKAQSPYVTWVSRADPETGECRYEDAQYLLSRQPALDSLGQRTNECLPPFGLAPEQEREQLQNKMIALGDVIYPKSNNGDIAWPIEALNQLTEKERQRIKILFFSPKSDPEKTVVPALVPKKMHSR